MADRSAPLGTMLTNGYQSLIAISNNTEISFWEKTVQPVGLDGGEPIDVTTQHNTTIKTKAPQALPELTASSITAAFDPIVLNHILAAGVGNEILNHNQLISHHMPDTSQWDTYGFFRSFIPAAFANGTHPEATIVIEYTGLSDAVPSVETMPLYIAPSP